MTIEVSSWLLKSLITKEKEQMRCVAVSILAFLGMAFQLASIVVFVLVSLLTGVVNVALVPQPEHIGKGGDSPGESSGEKSQS